MIAEELNFKVTSIFVPDIAPYSFDGYSSGNSLYNIGHERALAIWNKHTDYFNQFDGIITSDTAPLSRIFLQNNYEKPVIIWVCNRFDYADTASLDCEFPDQEYYELLQQATLKENVFIIPYTAFESLYAEQKNVTFNDILIKPSGIYKKGNVFSSVPHTIDKSNTFFIPPYLNDRVIPRHQIHTPTYTGRYNGPNDLKNFKGIIHIPYTWSSFAFFENMHTKLPYLIPSIDFLMQMYHAGEIWWPNGNFLPKNYHLSEWYDEKNSNIITYFDSWDDLNHKIETIDFNILKAKVKTFARSHTTQTLEKWNSVLNHITNLRGK